MYISGLIKECGGTLVGTDVPISELHYDSRQVIPGSLFFAVSGSNYDGHNFAPSAVANGASALVVERVLPDVDVPQWVVPSVRESMGRAAHVFYGRPSESLHVVAVTGTNGKTTTTFLVKQALEALGHTVALAGTIQNMIGTEVFPAARTTPEAIDLHRFMAQSVEARAKYFVFEASSHGVALGRLDNVAMDCVVFTNLSQDHLDFHGTMEAYYAAKARLFLSDETAFGTHRSGVINEDDGWGRRLLAETNCINSISFGLGSGKVRAEDIELLPNGVKYRLTSTEWSFPIELPLAGRFNVLNSLAAFCALLQLGIELKSSVEALKALRPVPGRFEPVDAGQDFMVVVDYAHTPDGLLNVLTTARSVASGNVITVFGAGGDRDRTKRPLMARSAAELSDYLFITSDNPRNEDPSSICDDIERGLTDTGYSSYEVIVDRRSAIEAAVSRARSGDIIVIAGKGHETYQESHGQRIHFDDRQEAFEALKELV